MPCRCGARRRPESPRPCSRLLPPVAAAAPPRPRRGERLPAQGRPRRPPPPRRLSGGAGPPAPWPASASAPASSPRSPTGTAEPGWLRRAGAEAAAPRAWAAPGADSCNKAARYPPPPGERKAAGCGRPAGGRGLPGCRQAAARRPPGPRGRVAGCGGYPGPTEPRPVHP